MAWYGILEDGKKLTGLQRQRFKLPEGAKGEVVEVKELPEGRKAGETFTYNAQTGEAEIKKAKKPKKEKDA